MNRGNSKKVMRNAAGICRQLRTTPVTVSSLMRQYHCGYATFMRAVRKHIKPEEWEKIRKKKLAQGGVQNRFQKGQTPWNRGKKGIHLSPASEFKKGHVPVNHKKLGTIRTRTRRDTKNRKGGSYRVIATPGPTPHRHIWIPYARYLWEQKHGPVPAGYFVVHADGNRLNDTLQNYKLVDRKGHLALMKENNPGHRKKAIRSLKKTVRKRRREKARAAQEAARLSEIERKKQERARELLEAQIEAERRKEEVFGPETTWWECIGCSFEFETEPKGICPKCNGLRFEKITGRLLRKRKAEG